ncbi:MAG: ATP-grasp domain-containing protein [Halobacteriovoraceae bacterium]|nr:ATP-grasp domain-containing protein [Halobacteriovoraceae bacterium]
MKAIKRILIANRAEIALRVMRTCRAMGIETVTIFHEDEIGLPHTFEADYSICLGNGELKETYLNISKIINIAKDFKVDAIHPGYGFLSENAEFAAQVVKAGIIFIGPRPENIVIMGDKKTSKLALEKINAPLIPGYHGDNQDSKFLKEQAKKIGIPVLIKASAGGGGKGMKIVERIEDFLPQLESAKREALKAFGDDTVLIEKYIQNPRHIEVQIVSDNHGQHFHFYERECSIQRRHQKIIEETPSMALDDSLRKKICESAVEMAKGINYLGAGTVEFILSPDNEFFFLEMNTRLQVEHPITEEVTGFDLVELQIKIAKGVKLNLKQKDIKQKGHALEVRVYAEDPDNNFLPTVGKISYLGKSEHCRLDIGIKSGNQVLLNFDPMLGKIITHGNTRTQAINKMKKALTEIPFLGTKTNIQYLLRILDHPNFKEAETYTSFVETHKSDLLPAKLNNEQLSLALAAFHLSEKESQKLCIEKRDDIWEKLNSFRNA